MTSPAVEVERLGKLFRLYSCPRHRVLETLSLGRWRHSSEHWALRGLDLAVLPGAVLGICGENGAGKSTLLKILAGTTSPSEGRYRIRGRVNGFLDLGTGFDAHATGRENLLQQGILLGYGRRLVTERMDEIVEFAELGRFIDQPLRTYSAGMGMRLGFSMAALLDPDVLILDEVFAVGDVSFQKKCLDKLHEFKRRNKTILFCSHSIYDLRQMCDEAIWLNEGKLAAQGDVVGVTGEYATHTRTRRDLAQSPGAEGRGPRAATPGMPCIRDVRLCWLGSDEEVAEARTGDSVEVRVWWEVPGGGEQTLQVGVGFVREDNTVCAGVSTHFDGLALEGAAGCVALRLPGLQLLSGRYLVAVWLMDATGTHRHHEYVADQRLVVPATTGQLGVFVPRHEWVLHGSAGRVLSAERR